MADIVITRRAAKDLNGLPAWRRTQVEDRIERMAAGDTSDVRKIVGTDFHRLRVGIYRVVFRLDQVTPDRGDERSDGEVYVILRVLPRGGVY